MATRSPQSAAADAPTRDPGGFDYFHATRGPWYGFLFALPVLLAYEALELWLQPQWTNGADAILARLLAGVVGPEARATAMLVILVVAGLACWWADRRQRPAAGGRISSGYLVGMFAESLVYALLLGSAVNFILGLLLPGGLGLQIGGVAGMSPLERLTMALGAGIYEELLFRVLIMGGLALLLIHGLRVGGVTAWIFAAVVSSVVFSLFHYLGPGSESFAFDSFLFRTVAGGVLAAIYGLRGFGIAVWAHALYDVFVMFVVGT